MNSGERRGELRRALRDLPWPLHCGLGRLEAQPDAFCEPGRRGIGSMKAGAVGLVLGKFAPLHRGQQLLIETVLAEVEHLVVLVDDCPETTRLPLATRSQWLRELYPSVEVIEGRDGPREVGNDPELT